MRSLKSSPLVLRIKNSRSSRQANNPSVYITKGQVSHKPRRFHLITEASEAPYKSDRQENVEMENSESQKTMKEASSVSPSLNTHSLKLSLKRIYNLDPERELDRIFQSPSKTHKSLEIPKPIKKCSLIRERTSRRTNFDSTFSSEQADMIMSEIRHVQSERVWGKILHTFREKPKLLLDLIPLKKNSFRKKSLFTARKLPNISKKTEHSASETPEVIETLHDQKVDELLTDDWKKSKLYSTVKQNMPFVCPGGYSETDISILTKQIPGKHTEVIECYNKAMNTLVQLLVDLLGTKDDATRFSERFDIPSKKVLASLLKKCSELFVVWKLTYDLLVLVNRREKLMKRLGLFAGADLKSSILDIYTLNGIIRSKLEEWLASPIVPFKTFIFDKANYLEKISDDNVELQKKMIMIRKADKINPLNYSTHR